MGCARLRAKHRYFARPIFNTSFTPYECNSRDKTYLVSPPGKHIINCNASSTPSFIIALICSSCVGTNQVLWVFSIICSWYSALSALQLLVICVISSILFPLPSRLASAIKLIHAG
ncbi:hypothetical protein B0H66DRAFT_562292 [Apodospora peruviana]|uniref:Uncharacterized protein n=1 Tax=Apodospora peruviana TaxID=516989 RepID=A0AAE0I1L5_9PEZI|nr:hypothetical protein B0H66DRAFT_562292 [Apodospora peruviana]